MSLKLIPIENPRLDARGQNGKKQKHFNPRNQIHRKKNHANGFLKNTCLKLIGFINRGGKFTYQQIDELIMGLQRTILNLQKQKQDMMRKKDNRGKIR